MIGDRANALRRGVRRFPKDRMSGGSWQILSSRPRTDTVRTALIVRKRPSTSIAALHI